MILSRITEHLKHQNWTAIFIDFVIVVVGVFIGLQVNNWNTERLVRAGEHDFLVRTDHALTADLDTLQNKMQYLEHVSEAGQRALKSIDDKGACGDHCWRALADFFDASQWRDLNPRRGVLDELQASPYPYDEALKQRLIDFYSGLAQAAVVAAPPEYRTLVRSLIPVGAQTTLWKTCHQGGGEIQRFIPDCAPGISNEAAHEIVKSLGANQDIKRTLTFYASTLVGVIDFLKATYAEGRELDVAIKHAQGSRRSHLD